MNGGYGLFAARPLPKGLLFSIYLGRIVEFDDKKRKYIIELSSKYVKKRNGKDKWEKVRKGRARQIIDALMSDRYSICTKKRYFLLGAHLMNDPRFGLPPKYDSDSDYNVEAANCVIHPLLEVITSRDIGVDEELLISYNRA